MLFSVSSSRQQVAYFVHGQGPALFLLHGFGEDSRIWSPFIEDLTAAGYQVILPEWPGFGQSPVLGPYSLEDLAEVVISIARQLHISRFAVLGHSMGGYVALALAAKHPNHLSGLGLVHAHPFADPAERREARQKSIEAITRNGISTYVRELIPALFAPAFRNSHPEIPAQLIEQGLAFPPEAYIHGLAAMRDRPDRTDVLRQCKVPVLFVIGRQDALVPQDRILDITHMPAEAAIYLIPEAGHMGMLETPEILRKALLSFSGWCLRQQWTP